MLCLCFHEWFHENVFQKKVCSKCRRTHFDVIALSSKFKSQTKSKYRSQYPNYQDCFIYE